MLPILTIFLVPSKIVEKRSVVSLVPVNTVGIKKGLSAKCKNRGRKEFVGRKAVFAGRCSEHTGLWEVSGNISEMLEGESRQENIQGLRRKYV